MKITDLTNPKRQDNVCGISIGLGTIFKGQILERPDWKGPFLRIADNVVDLSDTWHRITLQEGVTIANYHPVVAELIIKNES